MCEDLSTLDLSSDYAIEIARELRALHYSDVALDIAQRWSWQLALDDSALSDSSDGWRDGPETVPATDDLYPDGK